MEQNRIFYEESRSRIERFERKIGKVILVSYKRHEICYCNNETGTYVEKYATAKDYYKQKVTTLFGGDDDIICRMGGAASDIQKEPQETTQLEHQSNDKFYWCTCMPEADKPELAYNFLKYGEEITMKTKIEKVACPILTGEMQHQFTTAYPSLPYSEW